MGSYNAACSISGLSLAAGQRLAFIPLVKNRYLKEDKLPIPGHMLIYPHDLLVPFCLPILGEYDDYGSVENVEENANTKAIEDFFNMPIKDFISCVTCGREPSDYYSALFEHFVDPSDKEVISNYRVRFDGKFLEKVGFVRLNVPGEAWYDYKYKDFPYLVKLIPNYDKEYGHQIRSIGFALYDHNGDMVGHEVHHDTKKFLADIYKKETGYYIFCNEADQWKVKLLSKMSGMFVHGDIWDYMSQMKQRGFQREDFGEAFDKLRQDLIAFENQEPQYITRTAGTIEEQQRWHNLMVTIVGSKHAGPFVAKEPGSKYVVKTAFLGDPLQSTLSENYFVRFLEEWYYFKRIYRDSILESAALKEHFIQFRNFYWEMYSNGKSFFPTHGGEQFGNYRASLRLARLTVAILESHPSSDYDDDEEFVTLSNDDLYLDEE